MELGRVSFKVRDVADLLTLYGVSDAQREELLELARQANEPGWWQRYHDVVWPHVHAYLGLEQAASLIRIYELQLVTGLLQTEEYTRAMMRSGNIPNPTDEEIERRVTLRMLRQEMLSRASPPPPRLWVVLDEGGLRRVIGDRGVMRRQYQALIEANERPNVTVQVLPFHVRWHGVVGAFILLRFPEPEVPDIAYTEQMTSALYLDKQDDVDSYKACMDKLTTRCPPPERTPDILRQMIQET